MDKCICGEKHKASSVNYFNLVFIDQYLSLKKKKQHCFFPRNASDYNQLTLNLIGQMLQPCVYIIEIGKKASILPMNHINSMCFVPLYMYRISFLSF